MPPTGQRGLGPTSPRDFTGRKFAQQQKAVMDNATRDIDEEIRLAHKRGYDSGWSEGIQFIQDHFDVYELEDEDTNIEVGN